MLVVTSGATPYFLATYAGCRMDGSGGGRLAPCVVVFLLAQHAFHAVWKSKFYAFVLNHRVILHAIDATPAR